MTQAGDFTSNGAGNYFAVAGKLWSRPVLSRLGDLGDVAKKDGLPPGQGGCHPVKGCGWRS